MCIPGRGLMGSFRYEHMKANQTNAEAKILPSVRIIMVHPTSDLTARAASVNDE